MQQLAFRYATASMRGLWTEDRKFSIWRKLWVTLAESQWEVGLDLIQPTQIEELRTHINSHTSDPRQMNTLAQYEDECKHDVMAHIRLLGDLCPSAKGIIHLGATSCDITDNADLVLIKEALDIVRHKLVGVIDSLATVAEIYKDYPCLAYTHYQTAQLTTVGKRITLWIADFIADLEDLEHRISSLCFRGLKGATGTQDSFLNLLGDADKVVDMNRRFTAKMGFDRTYPVTGQTYSRKVDSQILRVLAGIGESAHKFGSDMRLLQHDYELLEPFGDKQIGSSAMPYKKNPMKAERLCSLARYLINESHNAEMTAMTQWLERSLDDSAGRRIYLPNAFLAVDAVLRLALVIANGIHVNREVIDSRVRRELPFLLMEPLMMEACKHGGDRQVLHAVLRDLALEAAKQIRCGRPNSLWIELESRPAFKAALGKISKDPSKYIGLSVQQVSDFIAKYVQPIRSRHPRSVNQFAEVKV